MPSQPQPICCQCGLPCGVRGADRHGNIFPREIVQDNANTYVFVSDCCFADVVTEQQIEDTRSAPDWPLDWPDYGESAWPRVLPGRPDRD